MRFFSAFIQRLDGSRLPEVASSLFAGLMLGLFPLAFFSGYGSITRDKFLILVIVCCDFTLALLLSLVWTRRFRNPLAVFDGWTTPQKLLLLFWLLALISAVASPFPDLVLLGGRRFTGLVSLTLSVGTALALAGLGRWHDAYFDLIAISSLFMSVLSVCQLLGGNPFGLYPGGMDYFDGNELYQGRFLGAVGNVDMLSAYWCLVLPLLLGGIVLLRGKRRWLCLLALTLGVAVEAAADVDAGLLALLLSALIFLPLLLPRRARKWAWIVLALLLLTALLLLFFYDGPEQGTLWELSRVLHGDIRDEFGSSRVLIWKEGWRSMDSVRVWLLGSGPGTRATHFETVFERVSDSGQVIRSAVDSGHNEYLDYLLELGAPGLVLYLAALLATLAALLGAVRAGDRRPLVLGWSLLAYCLQALFNLSSVVITPLFWTVWGLLLAHLQGPRPPLFVDEVSE
ncbi:MAG: O-antigen ligase family protein [Firmicutes bacterium]|nr:O-antigen ligase family protein [Bacillota bacterium]